LPARAVSASQKDTHREIEGKKETRPGDYHEKQEGRFGELLALYTSLMKTLVSQRHANQRERVLGIGRIACGAILNVNIQTGPLPVLRDIQRDALTKGLQSAGVCLWA
jgi:hypothetical protein